MSCSRSSLLNSATVSIPGPIRENFNFSDRCPPAIVTPAGNAFTPESMLNSSLKFFITSDWLIFLNSLSINLTLIKPLFTCPLLPRPIDEKTLAILFFSV